MSTIQRPRVRTRLCSSTASPQIEEPFSPSDICHAPLVIVIQALSALRAASRQLRRRGKGQIETLVANIRRFGCRVPILVTRSGEIIDGHAIFEACKRLGFKTIPTIVVDDLSDEEVRALRISLNKIAEQSVWDLPALKAEFEDVLAADPSLIGFTAFEIAAIDQILMGLPSGGDIQADNIPEPESGSAVSRVGDLWTFAGGRHKLYCGSAREEGSYHALLGGERVQMVCTDPPFGCAIGGHVSRSHGEFVEGSGMSEAESLAFFESSLSAMVGQVQDGAIIQLFIDQRGMLPLLTALRSTGLEQKTICVWDKQAGGMGSLYRQQVEFVIVAKKPGAPHINNVELGKHGRNRTTLWSYPGLAQFGRGRQETLAMHPTVKPVGLIADMLLDTSRPDGIVLDPFGGSGTLLLAAHRTKRLGRAIELDPTFVDVAVRRMETFTGEPGFNSATGLTFAETARQRAEAGTLEASSTAHEQAA